MDTNWKPNFKNKITKEELIIDYIENNKTMKQLCEKYNCSSTTLKRLFKFHQIARKIDLKNLTGKNIGKWKVLEEVKSKSGHSVWKVICTCGAIEEVCGYSLRKGASKGCNSCKYKTKNQHRNWKGYEEISATIWSRIIHNAKTRKYNVEISIKYAWDLFVKQNRTCVLTKLPLKFGSYTIDEETTASLDRIDSSKGYIYDNVRWIHKHINVMKSNLPDNIFKNYCKLIVENS